MAEISTVNQSVILTNQKDLVAQLKTSLGESKLVLKSLQGTETISDLFEFRVVFETENDSIDQDKALGTSFTVKIKADKEERIINGIVAEFSQGATKEKNGIDLTEYTAILRPKLWYLTLDKNYLIFQKKKGIDIIKKVLKDGGVTDIDDKTKSRGKVEREYCVQYGESSFNFVSRLMEDEGIFYFFTHTDGKHTMVLADSSSAHKAISGAKKITFMKGVQSVFPLGLIFNTTMTTAFNTGGYITADYNYTISATKLHSKLDSKYKKGPKYYEFPGNFAKAKEGDDIAKLRVEEFELNHCLLEASSTVPRITPGFSFQIDGHHSKKFNEEFIAYTVEHTYDFTGSQGYIYINNVKAFPKKTEFRAPRRAMHPRISGTQTAIVVCSSGEEIFVGEHCSIKVHFHWDQIGKAKDTEDSSCWIRVMQPLSGSSWGHVFVPRVGQEVVVAFVGGDPDRPIVVGCVYNDQFKPPYTEKEKMQSGIKLATFKDSDKKMFNEVRFNDEKDKQEIYVHAEKDAYINIKNSRKTEIEESDDTLDIFKGNRTITLQAKGDDPANHSTTLTKGDFSLTLTEGNQSTNLDKGNQTTTLKEGNQTTNLDKGNSDTTLKEGNMSCTLKKGNMTVELKDGNCTIKIAGKLSIKADKGISIESGDACSIKSTKDYSVDSKAKISMKSMQAFSNETGAGGAYSIKTGAGGGIKAESGAGGAINVKSGAGGAISVESGVGGDLKMKGGLNLKAEAMLNTEIKATVQAKVGGVMVEVQGQGMTKVGAPMITVGGGMLQLG